MAKPGPKPGSKRKSTLFVVKRPVGRPPKSASKTDTQAAPKTDIQAAPKRRGRPPKSASKPVPDADSENPSAPKRRGRIARAKAEVGQQHHNQEPEQAESSQVQPVEAVVLEVVGTSIQPAFVIQQHGVHSPNPASAQESLADKPQGILSKAPSKKEVAAAKKLAVKKTQAMKKTATKKVSNRQDRIVCWQWLAKQLHLAVCLHLWCCQCWHVGRARCPDISTRWQVLTFFCAVQAADVVAATSDAVETLEQTVCLLSTVSVCPCTTQQLCHPHGVYVACSSMFLSDL